MFSLLHIHIASQSHDVLGSNCNSRYRVLQVGWESPNWHCCSRNHGV